MITEQNLIEAGYIKFPKPFLYEHADYLYQKRVEDEQGIRYFIDIYHYPEVTRNLEGYDNVPEAYIVELQCDKFTFTMSHPGNLDIVEYYCELFWQVFWGKYYSSLY